MQLDVSIPPPAPGPSQLAVLPQLVEREGGVAQRLGALAGIEVAGGDQLVVHLHRQFGHVPGDGVAVVAR